MKRCLVWFRRDLRLDDNSALAAAVDSGAEVLPLYLHGENQATQLSEGGASSWWLHHALEDLDAQMKLLGGELHMVKAKNLEVALMEVINNFDIECVFWNRRYQPAAIDLDKEIKSQLQKAGIEVKSFNASVLNEPHEIRNLSGNPYQVFTPYWKKCRDIAVDEPIDRNLADVKWVGGNKTRLMDLNLLPQIDWDQGFYKFWDPTRAGAMARLKSFSKKAAYEYNDARDMMAEDGTSTLSPYLHFGQIGVREIYHHLKGGGEQVMHGYIRQLYWRDFAHHLIYHFPHSVQRSLRPEYDQFPWKNDEEFLSRWQKGQTGYPVIDAAMRQLWQTGWMHNRARMVVGSFLVKHLLQDWQSGADWFWDTLVDADLPNNTMGWQWVAGSGADAAPYFRVFNPLLQAKKFDKQGEYVRKYVPELAKIPGKAVHEPWELSEIELLAYGVTLGKEYPERMIGLSEGRDQALKAYSDFKELTKA